MMSCHDGPHYPTGTFANDRRRIRRGANQSPAGDKTMMDALTPALAALDKSAFEGKDKDIDRSLAGAARAACTGAESAKDMIKYCRARHLGEKACGFEDAGAASIA
jgi:dihydroxyacetone kinase-like protein